VTLRVAAAAAMVACCSLPAQTKKLPAQSSASGDDAAVTAALDRFFAADAGAQAAFAFEPALDRELLTAAGDARLRALAFAAFRRAPHADLRADFAQNRVRTADRESPYTVAPVGERPPRGWALVVAMHGGGGVEHAVNDQQWQHMQVYYRPHPEAGGYLYVALRAPNDAWNGFYDDAFYPLFERLVRQFVVCGDVDPDRVFAIGYSHGGYGAFALGPKLPHRFAAVHASAAAPSDGESSPVGLHALPFSFMVGGLDDEHGRRERCAAFGKALLELRREHPDCYATAFTVVNGNPHTGLPDRDLLPMVLAHTRDPVPRQLWWEPTDAVVRDHYWLHVGAPAKGQRLEAALVRGDGGTTVRAALRGVERAESWLDARRCDLQRDVTIDLGGALRTLHPAPTLATLCRTLLQRGDPGLAASWIVPLLP
jgi:predicted esterase